MPLELTYLLWSAVPAFAYMMVQAAAFRVRTVSDALRFDLRRHRVVK